MSMSSGLNRAMIDLSGDPTAVPQDIDLGEHVFCVSASSADDLVAAGTISGATRLYAPSAFSLCYRVGL